MVDGSDTRNMHYDSDGQSYGLGGSLRYTEPIGEKWTLSSTAEYTWSEQNPLNWEYAIARHFYELGLRGAADRQRAEEEEV